jgi:hypothetical protein
MQKIIETIRCSALLRALALIAAAIPFALFGADFTMLIAGMALYVGCEEQARRARLARAIRGATRFGGEDGSYE